MFSPADTIVAIATPPGRGGLGVVRLSGPAARQIARDLISHPQDLNPRHATLTTVRSQSGLRGDRRAEARDRPPLIAAEIHGTTEKAHAHPPPARYDHGFANAIDQVVATYFPAPTSYTGDDVVELSAHGSPVVLHGIIESAVGAGARLAEPGEFTLRAFLNGRINLVEAEAVRDLVDAVTPLQARAAFDQLQGTLTRSIGELDAALFELMAGLEASVDFPEEGYHFVETDALCATLDRLIDRAGKLVAAGTGGRVVREGAQVAIVGKPNVGKSSLFNALVGTSRAIVSDVPGTTRDLVTETVDVEGLRITLVDTAGMRQASDGVEAEGVERARRAQATSEVTLVVLDGSAPLDEDDHRIVGETECCRRLLVKNKADLPSAWTDERAISVSAATLEGVAPLQAAIARALDVESTADLPVITNLRHITLVRRAREAMVRARNAADKDRSLPEEFVLADLQEAKAALEEISGRRTSEDLLAHIFSQFCIGK